MDLDKLDKIGKELAQAIGNAAHQYGPIAWQTLLQIHQINCLANIVIGFILAIVAIISFKYIKQWNADTDYETPLVILFGIPVSCTIISCINLLDIWEWVGVFAPQLGVAHDIIEKILSPSH